MPEAAEVRVAAAQMDLVARGRRIERLVVTHPRTTRAQPVEDLQRCAGRRIAEVRAHGKWILVAFDDHEALLGVHLRMSGLLIAAAAGAVPGDRHHHARLVLGPRPGATSMPPTPPVDGPAPAPGSPGLGAAPAEVWFRDPRTFGELRILDGPPGAPDLRDPAVDGTVLATLAARRRVGVKAVLLDQRLAVSGIGSYLADEALHRAGISPMTPAARLHRSAWERVLTAARDLADRSAGLGGVTLVDEGWCDLWGRPGAAAASLVVHARESCGSCGGGVRRGEVGGRSTRWCPRCQSARRVR